MGQVVANIFDNSASNLRIRRWQRADKHRFFGSTRKFFSYISAFVAHRYISSERNGLLVQCNR